MLLAYVNPVVSSGVGQEGEIMLYVKLQGTNVYHLL